MKINVKATELNEATDKEEKQVISKKKINLNMKTTATSVDLRGMDAEEALYSTDKYLDEAYIAGYNEVTVIHGKGTGILRKAIQDMLKGHPHVKSFRLGEYGEGGSGVTVVTLK